MGYLLACITEDLYLYYDTLSGAQNGALILAEAYALTDPEFTVSNSVNLYVVIKTSTINSVVGGINITNTTQSIRRRWHIRPCNHIQE